LSLRCSITVPVAGDVVGSNGSLTLQDGAMDRLCEQNCVHVVGNRKNDICWKPVTALKALVWNLNCTNKIARWLRGLTVALLHRCFAAQLDNLSKLLNNWMGRLFMTLFLPCPLRRGKRQASQPLVLFCARQSAQLVSLSAPSSTELDVVST
jgi:hypothetical protein